MRIYVDTSVINGLFCQDTMIQAATKYFFSSVKFEHHTLYASDLVIDEIRNTPDEDLRRSLLEVVEENEISISTLSKEVRETARRYVTEKIIPRRYIADALHIAVASLHHIPVLVSWNFEL